MEERILWIEDDADIIRRVVWPLEKEGFEFSIIRTYSEYLDITEEEFKSFVLVIIDLLLPPGRAEVENNEELGILIVKDIREKKKLEIPIIVFTGIPRDCEYEFIGKKVSFMRKPILPSELQEEVHRVLP